jgi:hypothetical protein
MPMSQLPAPSLSLANSANGRFTAAIPGIPVAATGRALPVAAQFPESTLTSLWRMAAIGSHLGLGWRHTFALL